MAQRGWPEAVRAIPQGLEPIGGEGGTCDVSPSPSGTSPAAPVCSKGAGSGAVAPGAFSAESKNCVAAETSLVAGSLVRGSSKPFSPACVA